MHRQMTNEVANGVYPYRDLIQKLHSVIRNNLSHEDL